MAGESWKSFQKDVRTIRLTLVFRRNLTLSELVTILGDDDGPDIDCFDVTVYPPANAIDDATDDDSGPEDCPQ